jgi:hypothetical protein
VLLLALALVALFIVVRRVSGYSVPKSDDGSVPNAGGDVFMPPLTASYDEKVQCLAEAIARAEGFYVAGSLPQRQNNPGALKPGGVFIALYPDADSGWTALYNQVDLMLTGRSAYYNSSMTFSQIAQIYTGGDNAETWAFIVSNTLGLTPANTLDDYLRR